MAPNEGTCCYRGLINTNPAVLRDLWEPQVICIPWLHISFSREAGAAPGPAPCDVPMLSSGVWPAVGAGCRNPRGRSPSAGQLLGEKTSPRAGGRPCLVQPSPAKGFSAPAPRGVLLPHLGLVISSGSFQPLGRIATGTDPVFQAG